VSYQNAKEAAAAWLASAALPADLRGRVLELVTFASDEDCRFFYPRRALIWQQMVNTVIVKALRGRKGKLLRVVVTPAEYQSWLGAREDTPALRREYADGRVQLRQAD
jgi:hypothetical protein